MPFFNENAVELKRERESKPSLPLTRDYRTDSGINETGVHATPSSVIVVSANTVATSATAKIGSLS
jgi:hypothetical protein